jgi:hypothetical protein
VPKRMRALGGRHDASPLHGAAHHVRHAVTATEWPVWGDVADENVVVAADPRSQFEVADDGVSDVLRKR